MKCRKKFIDLKNNRKRINLYKNGKIGQRKSDKYIYIYIYKIK